MTKFNKIFYSISFILLGFVFGTLFSLIVSDIKILKLSDDIFHTKRALEGCEESAQVYFDDWTEAEYKLNSCFIKLENCLTNCDR